MNKNKQWFEDNLVVGAEIRIGKKYAETFGFNKDEIITLVEGTFENENGLYVSYESCPAFFDDSENEFDSIYHLFGNDFEYFLDCEVLTDKTE